MTSRLMETEVRAWRPQAFGRKRARDVRDPIIEPLWSGERILIGVDGPGAEPEFLDIDGEALEGPALVPIAAELREAIRTSALVLDGYLTRQATMPDQPTDLRLTAPSAGEFMSQMLFGRRSARAVAMATSARAAQADPGLPVGFVAIDLLSIDDDILLDVPLLERKRLMDGAFEERSLVRRTAFVRPPVDRWILAWRGIGFRELAYKGANSRYVPGRPNDEWAAVMIPRD
jgi:hypothetical protein